MGRIAGRLCRRRQRSQLALALEAQARGEPRSAQALSADYGDTSVEVALVSTTGIRSSNRKTQGFLSVGVIAGDGEASQTGGGFDTARGFEATDPDKVTTDAVERAVRMLGATKGPSGRSMVVFDRWGGLHPSLSVVSSAFSGEAVAKGRSFFAGRIGEQVGVPGSPWSTTPPTRWPTGRRPTTPKGSPAGGRPHRQRDADGLPVRQVAGSRAGDPSTGSAVRGGFAGPPGVGCRALASTPGPEGYDEDGVLSAVGEGLFVQSMTGVHSGVNPISGDFSVGAEGLMIRDGKLAEPVREITVASTLQRMLRRRWRVGADVEWLPGIAAGLTLAVADMQVSGI